MASLHIQRFDTLALDKTATALKPFGFGAVAVNDNLFFKYFIFNC